MKPATREIVVFAMLGSVMYASKLIMEFAPNIHLIGVFTIAFTVVYRKKALYPIYIYVLMTGIFNGFATWWIPYLYLWTVLWGTVMLLPVNIPKRIQPVVYMLVCAAHGFLYGTLYAPAQALLYGLSFQKMVAWIIAGLPFDCIHGVSNFFCGILIMPVISTLRLAGRNMGKAGDHAFLRIFFRISVIENSINLNSRKYLKKVENHVRYK